MIRLPSIFTFVATNDGCCIYGITRKTGAFIKLGENIDEK